MLFPVLVVGVMVIVWEYVVPALAVLVKPVMGVVKLYDCLVANAEEIAIGAFQVFTPPTMLHPVAVQVAALLASVAAAESHIAVLVVSVTVTFAIGALPLFLIVGPSFLEDHPRCCRLLHRLEWTMFLAPIKP